MHPRLEELVDYLHRQRRALEGTAARLPVERWRVRPRPDAWSVAQILDHLQRVDASVARVIAKIAQRAAAAGLGPERETSSVLGALDGRGIDRREPRREAPELVRPRDDVEPETVQGALRESRELLLRAIQEVDGLALGEVRHPHPVLGEIDLYQWILFVGHHDARHAPQVHETVRAVGDDADGLPMDAEERESNAW